MPHVWLCFDDGSRFAQLNARLSDVIPLALDVSKVTMQGLVDLVGFRQAAERATKATDATVRVGINVHGPLDARDEVGEILSKGKVWLQEPDYIPEGTVYDNPHIMRLDELPEEPTPEAESDDDVLVEAVPQRNSRMLLTTYTRT